MSISNKRVASTLLTAASTLVLTGMVMIAPLSALAYDFTRGLTVGSTGADVMALQQYLNGAGSKVSDTGAGSPGSESTYFGTKTKAAVAKWQTANGVAPAVGYFGSISKAKYVALTGGVSGSFPAGCTSTSGFSTVSGVSCSTVVTSGGTAGALPAGCTSAVGYSPSTGVSCSSGNVTTIGQGLNVMAGMQPSNSIAPNNASRLPFTVVKFVASNDGAVTVNSLVVERTGLANDAAFSGVVLLDENGNQVGIAKTLNSLHQVTLSESFVVAAGQTRTMTIAANRGATSAYAGQIASFSLVAVNSNTSVNGTLPVVGAAHTINETLSMGSVTMQRGALDPGSSVSKEVGVTGYTFTSVKVTAGSVEDVILKSVRFNQTGSAGASDVANLKAYVDGTAYDVVVSSDGKYYTASFGTGLTIAKGFSKEVSIKGDVVGGSGRTIDFDIAKRVDVNVVGAMFGYGITPPQTGATVPTADTAAFSSSEDPWYDAAQVAVTAGNFNVSISNSIPAQNIAVNLANQPLGAFVADVRGEPISVAQMIFTVGSTTGSGTGLLTSVSVYNANGSVVAGPVDGVYVSALSQTLTFSDSVVFPVGTNTYTLKGKVASTIGNNGTYIVAFNPSSAFTTVIGQTTSNTIIPSPASTLNMSTMTVKSGALAVSVSSVPIAQNVIAGSQGFTFASYIFDSTASGEDVRLTSIPLAYDAPGATATDLSSCQLYDGSTSVTSGSNVKNPSTAASTTSFTFDGNGLTVPKGTSKTLSMKCNLGGGVTTGAYTWGLADNSSTFTGATGLTSGQTITETMTAALGQRMTVSTGGTLAATLDTNSPGYSIVKAGATSVTLAMIRFSATNEDIDLKQVALQLSSVASNTPVNLVSRKVTLWDGSTQVGEATFPTSDSATSSQLSNFRVPRDGYKVLTVKGDIAAISNSGPLTTSGDLLIVNYDGDNNGLNGNYGTGVSSGSTRNGSGADTTSSGVRVMKAYPTMAKLAIPSALLQTGADRSLYRFSVTANGGDVALYKLKFTVSSSSVSATTSAFSLYAYTDSGFGTADTTFSSTGILNANSYYNGCGASSASTTCKGPAVSIFMNKSSATTTYIVPSGATRYFDFRATVASVESGTGTEYITVQLEGDASFPANQTGTYGSMDTAAGVNGDANADFIWSPISTTTSNLISDVDYTNGYSVTGLPGTNMSAETLTSAN
jgi:hypothetical protein